MNSGWGPVFAAQTLWQQTQSVPFPPIARTNLGREKCDFYAQKHRMLMGTPFVGQWTSSVDLGRFLAWLASNDVWQDQLRQQVVQTLHSIQPPQRILVVDDTIHEGSTAILVLGLLQIIYPHTSVRFLNAQSWFRSEYGQLLLELVGPGAIPYPEKKYPMDDFYMSMERLATGFEEISIDSLEWQPYTVNSPDVLALSAYHPPEVWLEAARVVYNVIAAYVSEQAGSYLPAPPDPADYEFGITTEWFIMRDIWLENGITRRQAEQRYGLSREKVDYFLQSWISYDWILIEGHGRGARYVIPAAIKQPPEDVDEDDTYEAPSYYWLLPGRLQFAELPWYSGDLDAAETIGKDMCWILDQGVDCLLDVEITQEAEPRLDHGIFQEEAGRRGRSVITQELSIFIKYKTNSQGERIQKHHPNRKDIRKILDLIDQYLAQGRIIQVRADRITRAILAGCYLARHGQTGASALRALQAARATGPEGWKLEPPDRKARGYIRSWPAGM